MDDCLPLMLLHGNKKIPGSAVLTRDFIDLVEVKARIKRHEFVGITSAPSVPSRRVQSRSHPGEGLHRPATTTAPPWKQLLPACLNPTPLDVASDGGDGGGAGAASTPSSPGGSPTVAGSRSASTGRARRHPKGSGLGSGRASPRSTGSTGSWYHAQEAAFVRSGSNGALSGAGGGGGGGSTGGTNVGAGGTRAWQFLWKLEGLAQSMSFEATQETREALHRHTARWQGGGDDDDALDGEAPGAARGGGGGGDEVEVVPPRHLAAPSSSGRPPLLSEPSLLLSPAQVAALAAALPARFSGRRSWALLYATHRHGISLATLLRRAAGAAPSILVVKDNGGYVFGAFATEPWKLAPRFFGTGETFVFQLEPHMIMYPWKSKSRVKNDFFMYVTPDCLAVGGLGHFGIWLESDLLSGNSDTCGTFGSPCLAVREEFKVAALELWHVVG